MSFSREIEFLERDVFLDTLTVYDWDKDVYFLQDQGYVSLINLKNVEFIERIYAQ